MSDEHDDPANTLAADDWDQHWAVFGDPAQANPANGYRRRLVRKLLGDPPTGSTIVDLGSGQGQLALFLQSLFPDCQVIGVEYSGEGVRRATESAVSLGSKAKFVQRDLLLPGTESLSDGAKATFAVCSEVLEHVDDPGALLRNAGDYLAPGCRLVVTVPGGPRSALDVHIGHRQHFTRQRLVAILEASGFSVERTYRAGVPFFNLYRLAVILRGRRLIDDLSTAGTGGDSPAAGRIAFGVFDTLLHWNLDDAPFGWQIAGVARFAGIGGGVIITRTPLRITLGGGGTDLPSYYERFGGTLISAAVNKYVYITVNRTFTDDYFLKYSAIERVGRVEDIKHPIIREAFALHALEPAVEMVSVADIPAGTGLGSSGSFTVGLLRALYAFKRHYATPANLAEEACHIEIDLLGQPTGKQDQFIAAFGGLTCFEFAPDGQVHVSPLMISNETVRDLEENLLMFFTGYSREAHQVLTEQKARSESGDAEMIENLHYVKALGLKSKEALERGDTVAFATVMDEHWQHKKRRSGAMSNPEIDWWYQVGMDHGALGGKLVGAGAGGFLLFYTKSQDELRGAMAREGLSEVPFTFDHDGSVVLVRDERSQDERRVMVQCLVLAGGLGTRMRGHDPSVPKALLDVAGKPFAHWQLSWLAGEDVEVVYSIGHKGAMIRDYVGDGRRWGLSVRYVEERQGLLGTGGAVRLAVDEGTLSDRFFILYGDAFLQIDFDQVDQVFRQQGLGATMTVFENQGRWDQSNVVFEKGTVLEYAKGCARPPAAMRYIDYGLSEVDRSLVEERIPPGERYDLADLFTGLSREGRLGGFEAKERFFEVGSPAGLRDLEAFLIARGDAGCLALPAAGEQPRLGNRSGSG